ncbi:MAG: transcriptional repressor [Desulforhabdus sp.]|nr:transcriptional repressor [Desulforhabdus sp.]
MFRLTHQRKVILEELRLAHSHATADEIYERVKKRLPRISLGTIYRNLEILASHGRIRKLDFAGGQRRFDINLTEHYHVRCLNCGKLKDVVLQAPLSFDGLVAGPNGYEISGVRLEFLGLCPECKAVKQKGAREDAGNK